MQMIQTEILHNTFMAPSWMYYLLPEKVIIISNHLWKTTIFLSNWIKAEEYLDEIESWSQVTSHVQDEPNTE